MSALLTTLFLFSACGDDAPPNPYNLTAEIRGDPSIERTWVEPAIEKVATLAGGEKYPLYNPGEVELGSDGRIYVVDFGRMRVKGFTQDGTYLRAYGRARCSTSPTWA